MKRVRRRLTGAVRLRALLCALLAAIILATPCAVAQEIPELLEPVGVRLDTEEAYIGEISKIDVYNGAVVPYVEELYLPVEGVVDEVHAVIGQEVQKGELLLTLDREAQDERAEALREEIEAMETNGAYDEALAEIDLSILQVELQALMNQTPRDEHAIASKNLDIEAFEVEREMQTELRELELSRLQKELEKLEEESSRCALYAPFDGQILHAVGVQQGDWLSAYAPVFYLADDARLTIQTEYLLEYRLSGAHAIYALAGDRQYALTQVTLDHQEHIARVLAGETVMSDFVVDDPEETLTAGMYAAVCVESQYVADALLVPANALYVDSAGKYVYVVEDGERVRRGVETGVTTDWLVQITEGLEEGEAVYVKD